MHGLDVEHTISVTLAVESFGGHGTTSVPIFKTLAQMMVANRSCLAGYISKASHCIFKPCVYCSYCVDFVVVVPIHIFTCAYIYIYKYNLCFVL